MTGAYYTECEPAKIWDLIKASSLFYSHSHCTDIMHMASPLLKLWILFIYLFFAIIIIYIYLFGSHRSKQHSIVQTNNWINVNQSIWDKSQL